MKALMYLGPRNMPMQDIPEPAVQDGEVKIKVTYCGICGSDIHGYSGSTGRKIPPMIMGHEFCGTVAELGAGVTGFTIGQRVVVLPVESCGTCPQCRAGLTNICQNRRGLGVMDVNGAFTEYICFSAKYVYPLPDSLSDVEATLLEPLAVAFHAVRSAQPVEGKNVMLVGAGTIGQLILKCLALYGCKTVIASDVVDTHLQKALENGADVVVNPMDREKMDQTLREHDLLGNIDVTIEAVGATPTVQQSIDYVANHGRVVWVGNAAKMVEINMQSVVTREVFLRGSYAYDAADFEQCLKLMAERKLDVTNIISGVVNLDEVSGVMDQVLDKKIDVFKVVAKI